MNVVVVTSAGNDPASGNGLSLRRDIELVRAAVLYADEVELISLNSTMLRALSQLGSQDTSAFWRLLASLDEDTFRAIGGDTFPAGWRENIPLLTSRKLRRAAPEFNRAMAKMSGSMRRTAEEMMHGAGADELARALELGIVTLTDAGNDEAIFNVAASHYVNAHSRRTTTGMEGVAYDWLAIVADLLRDPRKRLLFDDVAGNIAGQMIDTGVVQPASLALRHAGEAAVGSGLIARLPAFPQARLDELLDLRSDLSGPLARYRKAVKTMADKLTLRGFDADVAAEIDDLWTVEVAPALAEIKEGFAQHGLVREIGRSLRKDVKTLIGAGAAIYVGFDQLTTLNSWVSATAALAAAGVHAVAQGTEVHSTSSGELQGRDLYYLYQVNTSI